jgi:cytochrome c oxidase subunit 2
MPKSSTDKRHFAIVGVLVVVTTVVMGLLLNGVLPLPEPGVTQASTVDWLFRLHMWLIAILFALVVVLMVYSFYVFRRGKRTDDGEHFEGNTTLEIAWTVIPLVVVVIFTFIGIQTLNEITANPADQLVVKVDGRQWSWLFEYPDGTQSAELVVPVNTNLRMEMTASDVIHSFWVPEWRVKQDLVPGLTTHVNFTTDLEGEFELMCNQACGRSHTDMVTPVRVVSEQEFTAWLHQQMVAQGRQTASK